MKPPPMALPQPVPVGERYLLIRRLAVGGVADIFLARQSATAGFEKDVVIKRLRPELRSNSRAVRMFLEEARIGALLNHPNVVHVYDVDVADGAPYIAMEYIVGGELGTLCRRGLAQKKFLPLEHAVELMRQAAAGLGYLHAKRSTDGQALQICHRDLSPNNLLVTEDGFLKIIDFGIAKTWRSDAAADRVLPGKLGYLSPEQVARTAVDQRTDIFSLGVVLYEITLGRRLFKGPAHEVVRMIREHVVEPPTFVRRSYPPALEEIVMRALSPAPARRYQSAYDLADDLEQFLQDAKLSSGPVRIARYLDELAHAEGGSRRPELVSSTGRFSRVDLDLEAAPFRSFRAAPGREWDDAEEPVADVASALGIDVSELRAMRVPPAEPKGEAAGQPVSAVSSPVSAVSSPVSS
ncbi:MAG TPA: serine/threonine-protein kinase, partial [Kofleriaceae bacterium]|nr:serine/threonine-protein kinase [Kofleriaceae bacterium]